MNQSIVSILAMHMFAVASLADSLPRLEIAKTGSTLQLSWPTSAERWSPCKTGDLSGGDWTWISTTPTVTAGQNTIVEPSLTGQQFFQLRKRGAVTPFTTLEAEAASNATTGTVVSMATLPTSTTSTPELEASGRAYVALTNTGHTLDFSNVPAANTIVVRHCIPDAPAGDGITATLSLYVNGVFRQTLSLSSRHNWLYGAAGANGQSNDPTLGNAHVFWDESRSFIAGGVQAGDTLRLQRDAGDTAAFYRIDCIDLETAPGPLPPPAAGTYLSVADYGANGSDTNDDTAAIASCITAAKTAGKSVFIPVGTYYQNANFTLDGVTVRGAGMWHTQLVGTVMGTSFAGNIGFVLKGSGATVSDMAIDSDAHTYRSTGGKPFTATYDNCTNWRVENVWITHTNVGFWLSRAVGGVIRGCRVRLTYADSININRGSSNIVIEHNHVRGSGDDGIAILSETGASNPYISTNNTIRFNTVIATWWGHNCDLAGGGGHVIEDNYLADNVGTGCFTINLPSSFLMYPVTGAMIRRNTFVRGGGNYGSGQKRGAVWIYPGSTTISGVTFRDNEIRDAIFRGIHIVGSQSQSITFERNVIDHPGEDAIRIQTEANGAGIFTGNVVRNLNAGFSQFSNSGGTDYSVTLNGNSW